LDEDGGRVSEDLTIEGEKEFGKEAASWPQRSPEREAQNNLLNS
jgi:hypothetical protein